jgi:glutathione-regulated potassium-efflux system ancillary protein KefC
MDSSVLFNIFIFLTAACVVVPIASRFKLGSVLGYLAAGILIGPFGLGLIGDATKIMHFAEFGVVMMLFVIGLELEPAMLWRLRKSIVGLGGLQVCCTSVCIAAIGMAFGFAWQTSLAVGMGLSLSSTAFVLQSLQEKSLMQTPVGENSFAVLLFQDIAVIPILVLMPLLAFQQHDATHTTGLLAETAGWIQAGAVALVIASVIALGRYVSPHLFRTIAKTNLREVFTATSLALVVGITLLMQLVGVSPALGAFVAGVVLANSSYRRTIETDLEPFKGLLLGLFFISVGMGMDFALFDKYPLYLPLAVLGLVCCKAFILFVLGRYFGLNTEHRIGLALVLSQGGEFAFVLFQFAGGLGILNAEESKFLTLLVALSLATTPLLMVFYSSVIVPRFMTVLPHRDFDAIHEQNSVIIAGFGRFGQVVGRFISGQGVKITVLEKNPEQIELLTKFGYKGYFGDAERLDILRNAGAANAKLIIVAVGKIESCLQIVRLIREEFPHVTIFARARNRRHAYELHKLGVTYFKRETLDSSLTLAQKAMVFLGNNEADMQYKAEQFLRHDEATLHKSFEFFENEPQLVNFGRLRREELERILQEDIGDKASNA